MTNTTTEAVERLAAKIVETWPVPLPTAEKAAATLRALAAERDTWRQTAMDAAQRLMVAETERDAANLTCETAMKAVTRANAARDAALAREARLREALRLAVPMMEEAQEALCGRDDVFIVEGEDGLMLALDAARAALAQEPPNTHLEFPAGCPRETKDAHRVYEHPPAPRLPDLYPETQEPPA